nr:nicotinamide riboside transporter PnuC [uncultured Sphingomonas sp.]
MPTMEMVAVTLGIINVALVVKRSIWNYPFGLAMVALYFVIFLETKLYSDVILQLFFFVIQIYGWWAWSRAPQVDHGVAVTNMANDARIRWIAATVFASLAWGLIMHRFTDAAAPFVDATVAGLSVAAQFLQSLRRVECWMLWIAADAVAIGLYAWKGLALTSGLYGLFLILAIVGLIDWRKKLAQ